MATKQWEVIKELKKDILKQMEQDIVSSGAITPQVWKSEIIIGLIQICLGYH